MNGLIEIGIATVTTTAIATNVNADMLWTALIGFAVSLVTVVGGELIKFLTAYLKNKTKNYENKEEDKK